MKGKRFVRIPEQGQVAGVCAGLAEYFDIDVSIVRVGFVLATIFSGGGFLLGYFILAIIMPAAGKHEIKGSNVTTEDVKANIEDLKHELEGTDRGDRAKNLFGAGLVVLGLWLLFTQWFPEWADIFSWEYITPLALIAIGLYIVTRRNK